MNKILLTDGNRVEATRNCAGEITGNGKTYVPTGWTPGDVAGYNVSDYFSADDPKGFGAYLGADEFGTEPIFEAADREGNVESVPAAAAGLAQFVAELVK